MLTDQPMRFWFRHAIPLVLMCLLAQTAMARVVINEIFYNAPEDVEDLEYIELYNSGDSPVDLGGWSFTKGIKFKFPKGTTIDAKGFLVVCRNAERFKQNYDVPVAGTFNQKLSNAGERLELSEPAGRKVDSVKYQDTPPWPMGADGASGSLERICPETTGEDVANWASSPLSKDRIKPAGTPGKQNANFSATLPPIISSVTFNPKSPAVGQAISVEVDVRSEDGNGADVTLLYRLATPGAEKPEAPVAMTQKTPGQYVGTIPGQPAQQLIRFRIRATAKDGARRFYPAETEPRPAFSVYVPGKIEAGKIPLAWILSTNALEPKNDFGDRFGRRGFGPPGRTETPAEESSHDSTFVYYDPDKKDVQLFDFVEVASRSKGQKVRFHKDQLLDNMSTINLIFESNDRFVLAEPLAYEVYRKAGMAAPQSYHVRLSANGRQAGYHLLVEQPNRAFLRRNKINDEGNMYKLLWYERGVVRQHEKKTNVQEGHDDIVALVEALEKTRGDEQWKLIQEQFDIEQVATYFAVNTVLSHWDGFFNNYLTYHDLGGTKKWTMYAWDQDKSWGYYDGMRPGEIFYDMPLTFGMEGDVPPGQQNRGGGRPGRGFGGEGPMWWRPGGYFSRPLLANPEFRKVYLRRTREILETVYTEEVFIPIIEAMGQRLRDEIKIRAGLMKEPPEMALERFERNLQQFRDHVKKRREFLLAQDELKNPSVQKSAKASSNAAN
jgi:spore coat protein CotH